VNHWFLSWLRSFVRACDQIQKQRELGVYQIGGLGSLLMGLQAQTPSLSLLLGFVIYGYVFVFFD
jgi:hypothetical protein